LLRTPLQLAASIGNLPLVKLLFETYHADDSLIAPDGQIALRLAVSSGHREIVNYLPSRRGGGFLRWQTQHQVAIRRIKTALKKIRTFLKFFVWDIPKFFVWRAPKHLIVEPVVNGCKWCWGHRKGCLPWCKHQIQQIPVRAKRFGKAVWKGIKAVPKAAEEMRKAVWKFGTETLPRWLKKVAMWFWELLTKRIPKAIVIALKWIWNGLSSIAKAVWNVVLKAVSLLHTVFEAVITFLRNLTLKDIWNGFCDLLRAIFITFPNTLWSWIPKFGKASYRIMKTLFGTLGQVIWWIIVGIGWVVLYVPKKFWVILQSLGGSFGKAWYEVVVWFSPKA
jgi:Ankyrin repeats (3 copies)